jgi:hypothetical protein
MRKFSGLAASVGAALGLACGPPTPPSCPEGQAPASAASAASAESAASAASAASEASRPAELDLELTPVLAPRAGVRGAITARGLGDARRAWRIEVAERSALLSLVGADGQGAIALSATERAGGLDVTVDRAISGELSIRYELALGESGTGELSSQVDPNRALLVGESSVMLPSGGLDEPIDVSLRIDPGAFTGGEAAGSFGLGATRRMKARARELRGAAFLVGELGQARFLAYEGHDEVAWAGFTQFDPRWVSAEIASTRSSIDMFFGGRAGPPFTTLIIAERRPTPFSLLPRVSSVLLRVDPAAPWDVASKLRFATELARRWLGRRIRFADGERAGLWLTEGFSRAIARDVLFALGLMTPAELGDELNGLLGTELLSPHHGKGASALASLPLDPHLASFGAARGALYAARLDLLIRQRSAGKRNLRELARALLSKAEARPDHALTTEAFVEALRAEAGDDEERTFRDVVERGADVPLPPRTLGPCFRLERMSFEPFELGFAELPRGMASASAGAGAGVASGPRAIASVVRGSAAERAGVRAGDTVVSLDHRDGRPRVPARLSLLRDGKPLELRYLPAGKAVAGHGFVREKSLRDEACTR